MRQSAVLRTDSATGDGRCSPTDIYAIAFAFATVSALLEICVRGFQMSVLDQATQLSLHMTWMIPLALMVLFGLIAAVLDAGSRIIGALRRPVVPIAVFAMALLAPPILAIGWLDPLAGTVLVVGIAIVSAQSLVRHVPSPQRLARQALPALIVAVLAVPTATLGIAVNERLRAARLPTAAVGAPNVLFIILDTVRASELTPYGYERDTTPNLDRLARAGVLFESAWSTSPWTLPSHASMFTGQYVHRLSTSLVDPLDETWPTLAEHFRDRGYATAGFTANLRYTSRETGLARGFVHYEDHPVSAEMVLFSSSLVRRLTRVVRRQLGIDQRFVRKHAPEMTDAVLRWLRRAGGRPFFVFVNYYDAHAPYVPPDSLASRFGTRRTGRALADLSTRQHWSAEEIRVERDAHDAMLIYLDGELGRLFDALDARGLAANTIVLVTADHGEQFGEHGLMDHGNSLYEPVLRVPLIVRYPPTIPAGVRVVSRVSLRDIAATVVDVAGQTPSPLPGTSLMTLADDDTAPASPLLSEVREGIRTSPWLPLAKGGMKSLVHDGMHYIREGDGSEQLYDLGADPDELRDLERSGSSHILELLRGLVDSLTSEAVIPR